MPEKSFGKRQERLTLRKRSRPLWLGQQIGRVSKQKTIKQGYQKNLEKGDGGLRSLNWESIGVSRKNVANKEGRKPP